MSEENQQLKKIIEGAILAAGEPLSIQKIQSLFSEDDIPEKETVLEALGEIQTACEERGFDLIEVASGWRFQVREDVAQWVNRLWEEKPQKYSRALLETLALIAYRQPLTRGDIEEVRGVAVSSHIIKTLTERDWVKVVGHRDVPGRPALYATTKAFLDYFNLKSLDELPTLGELKDIDNLNQDLQFENKTSAAASTTAENDELVEGEATATEADQEPDVPSDGEPEVLGENSDSDGPASEETQGLERAGESDDLEQVDEAVTEETALTENVHSDEQLTEEIATLKDASGEAELDDLSENEEPRHD